VFRTLMSERTEQEDAAKLVQKYVRGVQYRRSVKCVQHMPAAKLKAEAAAHITAGQTMRTLQASKRAPPPRRPRLATARLPRDADR
jgi:hypothetical protein